MNRPGKKLALYADQRSTSLLSTEIRYADEDLCGTIGNQGQLPRAELFRVSVQGF